MAAQRPYVKKHFPGYHDYNCCVK